MNNMDLTFYWPVTDLKKHNLAITKSIKHAFDFPAMARFDLDVMIWWCCMLWKSAKQNMTVTKQEDETEVIAAQQINISPAKHHDWISGNFHTNLSNKSQLPPRLY